VLDTALNGLTNMLGAFPQAVRILDVVPRMRGTAKNSAGSYAHREVLNKGLVDAAQLVDPQVLEKPVQARVIPAAIQETMYKGAFDEATKADFVKAVEKLVAADPPKARATTIYGFGRKKGEFAAEFTTGGVEERQQR